MVLILELLLAGLGAWVLAVRDVRLGGMIIHRPSTIYIGMILLLQLPVGVLASAAAGAAEGVKAVSTGGGAVDAKQLQKKYAWVDAACVGGAVALAVVIGLATMRQDLPLYVPPDEVAGVRDYVSELRSKRDAEEKDAGCWQGEADANRPVHRKYYP
jgi:hypothetical protein